MQKSPETVALIWERDEPGTEVRITYRYCVSPKGGGNLDLSAIWFWGKCMTPALTVNTKGSQSGRTLALCLLGDTWCLKILVAMLGTGEALA